MDRHPAFGSGLLFVRGTQGYAVDPGLHLVEDRDFSSNGTIGVAVAADAPRIAADIPYPMEGRRAGVRCGCASHNQCRRSDHSDVL